MNQLGVDYASVDGNDEPDFVAARAGGVRFVYIRRSHCYRDNAHRAYRLAFDPCYARDAHRARAAGLTVGAYLFPSFAAGAPSPAEQVANFDAADGDILRGDLPTVLDVEFPGKGIVETGRIPADVFKDVLVFVGLLKKRGPVAIYTSHVQWHDSNGLGGPDDPALRDVVLWVKTPYRRNAGEPVDTASPREPHASGTDDMWRLPRPWSTWWVHQYQGDAIGVDGFSHTVDINRFVTLSASSHDPDRIAWIQRRLAILGAPLVGPLSVSGVWDNDTEHAVRAYQTAHGLAVDGVVGVRSFAALCWSV